MNTNSAAASASALADADADTDTNGSIVVIESLHLYPIKSCSGIATAEMLFIETGPELDRAWMVVDADDQVITQRELPRMALVQPTFKGDDMVLRAPGMLALHVALDRVEATSTRQVHVWHDTVAAYDMGDLCAQWFTDLLGRPLRLVRFDPAARRLADARWTGAVEVEYAFADAFPLLVTSAASMAGLNRRLEAGGATPVTMARFRPNIVLSGLDKLGGLDAHGEDALDEIVFDTADGPVRLKLVKPCARCSIPDVDPQTGEAGHAVGDALAGYRADARLDGALTFGMNAIVLEGIDRALSVGLRGRATFNFG